MTDFQTASQRPAARQPQRTIKPVLLTVALVLALTWTGAWLLHFSEGTVLAVTLAVLVLCLIAVALPFAFGKRHHGNAVTERRDTVTATGPTRDQPAQPAGGSTTEEPVAALNGRRWSLDVFAAMDAQRFAAVCETWFSWAGFDTRSEAHRTNEGVDIWLHAAKMPGPVAIVRCKHWLDKPVGLQDMKEFLGLVATFQSAHGTYTTTSTYTPEALQFAKENGIDAVDGRGLLRRIQTRTRQRQQALLAVAYHGHS